MNNIGSLYELPNKKDDLIKISSELLQVETIDQEGEKQTGVLINDLTIGNSLMDYSEFTITTEQWQQTVMGTGLVVSTSIGITGYALNL